MDTSFFRCNIVRLKINLKGFTMKRMPSLLLASSVFIFVSACSPDPAKKEKRTCEDGILAYNYAKGFVKEKLVSPSSANFPSFRSVQHNYLGNCRHTLRGHVDAQNRMGATLRMNYSVTVRYDGANKLYRLEGINIDER